MLNPRDYYDFEEDMMDREDALSDYDVLKEFWTCNVCKAQNHESDGDCQYCDCQGINCERNSCSDPRHFCQCEHIEHIKSPCNDMRARQIQKTTYGTYNVCQECFDKKHMVM